MLEGWLEIQVKNFSLGRDVQQAVTKENTSDNISSNDVNMYYKHIAVSEVGIWYSYILLHHLHYQWINSEWYE